jgi:hypothetical protein
MNVFELQAWLREFGDKSLIVDGIAGPKTTEACKRLLERHQQMVYKDPMLAAEQLIMKVVGGLIVGPIDGIPGPATEKARKHWLRGPWRNHMNQALPGDERMPKVLQTWPKYSELTEFFGEPGTNLVTIAMPYPLRPAWELNTQVHKITCNKGVAESLVRVHQQILADYGYLGIEKLHLDIWGGCYAARPMRGSTKLSTHAWAIAWDTDPIRNALTWGRDRASLAGPEYEKFWDAWTDEGWTSLGKARNYDWMHTQACQIG